MVKELPRWGQWIGAATGTNDAKLILNIDKDRPKNGTVYFQDGNRALSSIRGQIEFFIKGEDTIGNVRDIIPLIASNNDQEVLPKTAQLILTKVTQDTIEGTWSADNGQHGDFNLNLRESTQSHVTAEKVEWDEYLSFAIKSKRDNSSLIFRGQTDAKYPLRTTFHRTDRRDMTRYAVEDVSELNNYLAASNS